MHKPHIPDSVLDRTSVEEVRNQIARTAGELYQLEALLEILERRVHYKRGVGIMPLEKTCV